MPVAPDDNMPSPRARFPLALALSNLLLLACSSSNEAGGSGAAGGGGAGGSGGEGGGQGGGGGAPGGGPCQLGADCLENEYCHFTDHACGLGEPTGLCVLRPIECSHKPTEVCSCDGSVSLEDCPELLGNHTSVNGNCAAPNGKFACGYTFCKEGEEYCQKRDVLGRAGLETTYGCVSLPPQCAGDDSCACVSSGSYPCGAGTCADDAAGHAVVTCTN